MDFVIGVVIGLVLGFLVTATLVVAGSAMERIGYAPKHLPVEPLEEERSPLEDFQWEDDEDPPPRPDP